MKTYMFLNRSLASETFRNFARSDTPISSAEIDAFDSELEFCKDDIFIEFDEAMKAAGRTRIPWDNAHHSDNIRVGLDGMHKLRLVTENDSKLKNYYGESSNCVILRDKWKLNRRQVELGAPSIPSALLLSEKSIRDFFSSLGPDDQVFVKPRLGQGSHHRFDFAYESYQSADELIEEIDGLESTGLNFWKIQSEPRVNGDHMFMMKTIKTGRIIKLIPNVYNGVTQLTRIPTVKNVVERNRDPLIKIHDGHNNALPDASDADINLCMTTFKDLIYNQKDPYGCVLEVIISDGIPYIIDTSFDMPFGLTAMEPTARQEVVDIITSDETVGTLAPLVRQGKHYRAVVNISGNNRNPENAIQTLSTLRSIRMIENPRIATVHKGLLKINFNMDQNVFHENKAKIRQLIADQLAVDLEHVDI